MKVLYFGVLSEIAGKQEENLTFQGSIADFKEELFRLYPEIKDKKFQVAINQKIAQNEQVLEGDEDIALLPPFTGG